MVLGGFAAPLFLWLAGVGVALSAAAAMDRGCTRREAGEALVRRGLEIFVLAFLFRLQAFIVSPGSHPVALFRVDILNIMGPAMVGAGLVSLLADSQATLAVVHGALAAAIAMAAPLVRTIGAVDRLPVWVQWYIRPAGEYTTFTAFPWSGFVFAGAAVGAVLVGARRASAAGQSRVVEAHVGLLAAGFVLVWLGFYTASRPALYVQSSFWTSSPTYFAIRVGVMTVTLAALFGLEQLVSLLGITLPALARFGRRSLFVYWIHVELVYGYATWPLRGKLSMAGVGLAYLLFTWLIYGAVVLFDRWRAPRSQITLRERVQPAV
jgi:uncharacterized membrane protein